jgi:hypothetical protein
MSIFVELCEDPCPLHSGTCCCRVRGHEPPHRVVLIGNQPSSVSVDHVTIEWRPATDAEHWSNQTCEASTK